MTIIAEFELPASEFVLSHTFQNTSDVRIEVERIAVDVDRELRPHFWVSDHDLDEFEESLAVDPSVEDVRRLDDAEHGRLYAARWTGPVQPLVYAIDDVDGVVLNALGEDGRWVVRIMFDDPESLSDFHDFSSAYDLEFELRRLYEGSNLASPNLPRVSREQRELVECAYARGYFEVPREATLEGLAEEFDISTNAASKRLRRGLANVLHDTAIGSSPSVSEGRQEGTREDETRPGRDDGTPAT